MEIRPLKLWKHGETNSSFHKSEKDYNSTSKERDNIILNEFSNKNKTLSYNTPIVLKKEKKIFSKNFDTADLNPKIPLKILKLNKKVITLRKSKLSSKNIELYKQALIQNFKPFLNNQNLPKNKRRKNKIIEKSTKDNTHENNNTENKSNTLFQVYKNYQKQYFSSTFNLNSSNINNTTHNKINDSHSVNKYNSISNEEKNKTKTIQKRAETTKIKLIIKTNNSVSNLLKQKSLDRIPLVINAPITFIKNFKSSSERERDSKNSTALLRLRNILDRNWDKRKEIIKEFFIINQINDKDIYTNMNLENFAHFVHDNIDDDTNLMKGLIETRIPMKQIIEKGILYKNYSLRRATKSNSMPIIKNESGTNKIEIRKNSKRMSHLIKNFHFKGKTKNLTLSENKIKEKYQIEENKAEKNDLKEKIYKIRDFINKNYAANIINKFMRKYNDEEKKNYFNKRKVGTIYITDKGNLVNSINKQTEFFKLKSTAYTSKIKSIHSFTEKDFNDLYNELIDIKKNFIFKNEHKSIDKEDFWVKTYESLKKNIFEKCPEKILKEKHKLLEYIVYQNIKERKAFEKDILK